MWWEVLSSWLTRLNLAVSLDVLLSSLKAIRKMSVPTTSSTIDQTTLLDSDCVDHSLTYHNHRLWTKLEVAWKLRLCCVRSVTLAWTRKTQSTGVPEKQESHTIHSYSQISQSVLLFLSLPCCELIWITTCDLE